MSQKTKKRKHYVLDTSVLLSDPRSLFSFKNSNVVIPKTVLKELDAKKTLHSQVGQNARIVIKRLKALSDKARKTKENFIEGILCEDNNVVVRLYNEKTEHIPKDLDASFSDNRILSVVVSLQKEHPRDKVYLVTKDTSLDLIAQVHQLNTDDYAAFSAARDPDYTGFVIDDKPSNTLIAKLYEKGNYKLPAKYKNRLHENGFLILKPNSSKKHSDTVAFYKEGNLSLCNDRYMLQAHSIKPLNHEQYCAMSLLFNPDIPLVTINGAAGTGKSILAIAAGLNQLESEMGRTYKKVMFARSLTPLGGKEQIGYLKGSLEDKLAPWILPLRDNINYIMKAPDDHTTGDKYTVYDYFVNDGSLEIVALQYIRGRTLSDTFIIIDEVQNITRDEIYTIISRVGDGSKVVLLGDNLQVDAPYLSRNDNALVHVIEAFKDSKLAGHVTLQQSVRSPLAKEVAERLLK